MTGHERDLDRALSGGAGSDPELEPLVETARSLSAAFDVEPEQARRARAMFVQGAARAARPRVRVLVPVLAVATAVAVIGVAGLSARPGQPLYTVRKALDQVGLASSAEEEVRESIGDARTALDQAEAQLPTAPAAAKALVLHALDDIQEGRDLLSELGNGDARELSGILAALEDEAIDLIVRVHELQSSEGNEGPGSSNSGPGSDDEGRRDDEDDDNSGPGGGDDDDDDADDNSGPGGGGDDD